MSDRSSVTQTRLRRLTMALGALGVLGVLFAWLAIDLAIRDPRDPLLESLLWDVAIVIAGALPFLLITFGRPRRPTVSLVVCVLLLGLNTWGYLMTLALVQRSGFAGLNALGAVLYSWVIWGAGMAVDNWRRERTPPLVPPPRPDRH